MNMAGRVPERGEVIKHPEGIEFEVIDADARRVKRLRIRDMRRKVKAAKAAPQLTGKTDAPAKTDVPKASPPKR